MTLAVGFFDGVHLGHQAILRGADAALTFTNHPLTVLAPDRAPALIMSLDERLAAIRACGVRDVIALDFTPALAALTPEEFVEKLLFDLARKQGDKGSREDDGALSTKHQALSTAAKLPSTPLALSTKHQAPSTNISLRCGANWRFGKGGAGDAEFLRARGIPVTVVPFAVDDAGEPISSTRIRKALAAGDLPAASAMMGRPFAVRGVVRSGKGLGRTIGYPTQNLELEVPGVQLPLGVYVVERDGCRGVANYGLAPTLGPQAWPKPILEIHWLQNPDTPSTKHQAPSTSSPALSTKHQALSTISLLRFLRPERKFESLDVLKAQIARDCAEAMK